MRYLIYFLLFGLFLIPAVDYALAETWKVTIPTGSSQPTAPAHFTPSEISVRAGDKVQWGNADTVFHTVTSGTLESGSTGMFDSSHLKPGEQFVVLFKEGNLGEIQYFCTIHPWMIGIVNVIDLEEGFQVYHNVGAEISDTPVDVAYKVQRNLVSVEVEPARKMITFNFAGKIDNDKFEVRLPEALIKAPQSVWRNDKQITDYEFKKMNDVTSLTVLLSESTQQIKVVGVEVIGKSIPPKQVLINQMFGVTDKSFYERGEEIVISGEIKNPTQLYQISLDVISPTGITVYHKEIPVINSTRFSETIPTTGVLRDLGEYSVKITGASAKSLFLSFEYGIGPREIESPLEQMRSGVAPNEVECNEWVKLFMKSSNGKAVCLTKSTAEILLQRGWADNF